MDFSRRPSVDGAAFPKVKASGYLFTGSIWAVSLIKETPIGQGKSWIFGLSNGFTSNNGDHASANGAWCVKGGGAGEGEVNYAVAPPNHYTVSGGEVHDNYTGLSWQQGMSPTRLPRAEIDAYCAGLDLNGAKGWRVPTVHELSTLVDESVVSPSIDRVAFPKTPAERNTTARDWFWASNSVQGSPTLGWGLHFMDGFTGPQDATTSTRWNYWTSAWVKCVR